MTAKRSFSLLLCLVMLAGLFPTTAGAEVGGDPAQPRMDAVLDYSMKHDSSLGRVFANSINANTRDVEDPSDSHVSSVTVEEDGVVVGYASREEAELVVAFYEDPGEEESSPLKLLATTTGIADPESISVKLPLPEGLPETYLIGAFLLRSETHEPLCEEFSCSLYTRRYQDFIHAPLSDYEETGDRLLVLDEGNEPGGTEASFAVFAEDVLLVKETEERNRLTENEDGSYTFFAPEEALLALQPGDKLAHTALDGSVTVILVKSRSLDEASGALTLTHDDTAEAPVFFETIRIDTVNDADAEPIVDTDDASPGVEYLPGEEDLGDEVDRIIAQVEAGAEAPLYAGTDEAVVMSSPGDATEVTIGHELKFKLFDPQLGPDSANVKLSGKISITPELKLTFYFSHDINYFSVNLSCTLSVNLALKGTLGNEFALGNIVIPTEIPGIAVVIRPVFVLEFTMSLTFVAKWKVGVGVEYDDSRLEGDRWHPIKDMPTWKPSTSLKLEGKLKVGLRFRLRAEVSLSQYLNIEMLLELTDDILDDLKDKYLMMAGVSVGFLAEISSSTDLLDPNDSEIHDCQHCIPISVDGLLEMGYEVSALYGMIARSEDDVISVTVPMGKYYYSFDEGEFGEGLCPHRRYKLSVTAIDGIDYDFADLVFHDTDQIIRDNTLIHRVPNCVLTLRDKSGKYVQTEDLLTDSQGEVSVFIPSGDYEIAGYTDVFYGARSLKIEAEAREVQLLLGQAQVESGQAGALNWSFYPESGLLTISGSGEMDDYNMQADGSITEAPWKKFEDRATAIVLRPGVRSVGKNAFTYFSKVTELQIPPSCTRIGSYAFTYLNQLKTITLSASLESVGEGAFRDCYNLETVMFDGTMSAWNTLKDNGIGRWNQPLLDAKLVINSRVLDKGQCGDNLFWSLSSTGALTISGTGAMYPYDADTVPWKDYRDLIDMLVLDYGISSISALAFTRLAKVGEVMIPDSVTLIGTGAFSGCSSLTEVQLPEGLNTIPESCFLNCSSLCAVNLPYSLRGIMKNAFRGCDMGERKNEDVYYEGTLGEWNRRVHVAGGNEALLRVLTTFTDSVAAAGMCGDALEYFLTEDGFLVLEGEGDMTSHPWQDEAKQRRITIRSVRIPDGVTSVCYKAFADCPDLSSVAIPNSVETLGTYLFRGCTSLNSLTLPFIGTSRESSDPYALGKMFGPVYRSSTYDSYFLSWDYALEHLTVTDADSIPQYACSAYEERTDNGKCEVSFKQLKTLTLAEGLSSIGDSAFSGCSGLLQVNLPESLTYIGGSAFSGSANLPGAPLPTTNPLTIGGSAFYGSGLTEISIPGNVRSIGSRAFQGCSKLTGVCFEEGVASIGDYAFADCPNLSDIAIPSSVETLGTHLFRGCTSLNSLTLPFIGTSRESSDPYALGKMFGPVYRSNTYDSYFLSWDYALEQLTVTDADSIPQYACSAYEEGTSIEKCEVSFKQLKTLTLAEGLSSIGDSAFSGCSGLLQVNLPESLTYIGGSAFSGSANLPGAPLPTTNPLTIGDAAFYGSGLEKISIPGNVRSIGSRAFQGCSKLTGVFFEEGVTSIGDYAFADCPNLSDIAIPSSVETLGTHLFRNCTSLNSLTLPFIGTSRESSDPYALGKMFGPVYRSSTYDSYFLSWDYALENLTVTDADSIPQYACSAYEEGTSNGKCEVSFKQLKTLTLPETLISIGAFTFYDQTMLTDLFFGGTIAQWQAVNIGSGNSILSRVPIHCSDGDLALEPGTETEDLEDPADPEAVVTPTDADDGEESGSIGFIEPTIEPVPTEEPAPAEEPVPTEEPGPIEEPAPGYIGLASFSGESAPVDDTVYSASFSGLVPEEQYVLLITGEDVENLDLRFVSLLFIAQGAAGEDGTLRFSYVRLPSETAPVIRLYGRSDKDLGETEDLALVMHKGVSDPNAYSVHLSYEGTELKENVDYILSIEKQADGIIAVTVKGIRAYSGSRTVLAKETCLEAAETPDGYAVIHMAHTWGDWGIAAPATCEEPGEKARSCSVCGKIETQAIEAIGHEWGEPVWTWSEDLTAAEAAFSCAHDSSHVATLEASVSQAEEDEYGVFYTATVSFQGETYSDSHYLRLYLPGDLNRDGEVDSLDLLRLRQMLVGAQSLTAAADLNGDGTVNLLDLVRFRKYLAGDEVVLHDPKG